MELRSGVMELSYGVMLWSRAMEWSFEVELWDGVMEWSKCEKQCGVEFLDIRGRHQARPCTTLHEASSRPFVGHVCHIHTARRLG